MLQDRDADRVHQGIEAVGRRGSAAMVRLLEKRIRQGLPADLLLLAVQSLGAAGRPESGPLLIDLLSYRRANIRVAAIHALTDLKPPGIEATLIKALSDAAPSVRAAAAVALGQSGSEHAIDPLFLAFERGIEEAAPSLGLLALEKHLPRILGYLGERSLETLAPTLLEILSRENISMEAKIDVIARLGEMGTGDVRRFLEDFSANLPDQTPTALRQAAEGTAARIGR